jgi:hypothetical protein
VKHPYLAIVKISQDKRKIRNNEFQKENIPAPMGLSSMEDKFHSIIETRV